MHESFFKFRLLIGVLLVSELLIGLAIVLVTVVFQNILDSFVTPSQSGIITSNYLSYYLLGFQLFVIYLYSLCMWKSVWMRRYSASTQTVISVWLLFSFVVVLCGCAAIWSMAGSVDAITENVAMLLFDGIDAYYKKSEWKLVWDQVQYNQQCCGVYDYLDWMHATWMNHSMNDSTKPKIYNKENYEQQIVESLRKLRSPNLKDNTNYVIGSEKQKNAVVSEYPDDRVSFDVQSEFILAPYACCKHDSTNCHKSYLPDAIASENISPLNLTEIYTDGCLDIFRFHLCQFVGVLFSLIMAELVLNIFVCCLTRILMRKGCKSFSREIEESCSYFDDDGNALVFVKCPPKVKCITLEEQISANNSDLPYICSDTDPYICCCEYDVDLQNQTNDQGVRNDLLVH